MPQKICVCGAGTMGTGIAQAVAQAGIAVILFDLKEEFVFNAKKKIASDLQKLVDMVKINPQEKDSILGRFFFTSNIQDCRADIIIEAIIEKIEAKENLFNQLALINNPKTIFATNTSSLSVTEIAKTIPHPERVVGMHFFNPATIMKLVELVRTDYSSEDTINSIVGLAKQMSKTPVLCKDAPGFIVNHVARPYYLESLRLVEQGLADFETIDRLMESTGFKMGPFKLMDLIGNDINYAASSSVYEALNKPERLKPSQLQEKKVNRSELGKKTGKGFYDYE